MLKSLTVLFFCFASIVASACPETVNISVSIGELQVDNKTDADFLLFSNTEFQQVLVSEPTTDGCLYASQDSNLENISVSKKLYLLLSANTRGEKVQLNGYSSQGKMFEIRTTVKGASLGTSSLDYPAGFYDASGPAKELLGPATVSLD